ncbi:MAG: hypothetical protein SFW09_17465 [Hyphomicrobiaceae bacterium]|nr:hypothetical protein [Hyphomicrobiaceae bacterium]
MPLQNRVTPEGEIISTAARGMMMGNRGGALHDAHRRLGRRRWINRQWICCRLDFKGRRRQLMAPGRYTELFFLDEATALAAGHRPCFECRRQDALRFATLWATIHGSEGRATAGEMDVALQAERVTAAGTKVTHTAAWVDLPTAAFVRREGTAMLILDEHLVAWSSGGYAARTKKPRHGKAEVLTPQSIVAVIAAGYRPALHPSAGIVQ